MALPNHLFAADVLAAAAAVTRARASLGLAVGVDRRIDNAVGAVNGLSHRGYDRPDVDTAVRVAGLLDEIDTALCAIADHVSTHPDDFHPHTAAELVGASGYAGSLHRDMVHAALNPAA